jgi:hypothetical protein
MDKYIVTLESEKPLNLCLGDQLGNGVIIELKKEELPKRITVAWLSEKFNLSKKTIIEKVGIYNKGDENKHLYDPKEVLPILENLYLSKIKRQVRRKQ